MEVYFKQELEVNWSFKRIDVDDFEESLWYSALRFLFEVVVDKFLELNYISYFLDSIGVILHVVVYKVVEELRVFRNAYFNLIAQVLLFRYC